MTDSHDTATSSEEIPLFRIDWSEAEIKNAIDSITRGGYWANGPYIDRFEARLEEYLSVEYAVVFNSGTSALMSVLEACGIGPGDEVIVPSFTFISTANAAKALGANPVFADIEPDRYGLDPTSVKEHLSSDTAAIVPVHYAGGGCRVSELRMIADANGVPLIEDAAEALGATVADRKVGTYGHAGMLSFCQNKVITTGEGGAIVTDDDEMARRLRLIRSHGQASGEYFSQHSGEYMTMGYNYRMPDIVASLGVAQMDRIEELVAQRRRVASRLSERLKQVQQVQSPSDPPDGRHVYQLYTVTFDDSIDRDAVSEHLSERNIGSKVYFDPVHLSRCYREEYGYEPGLLPVTEDVSGRVLSLPLHPNLNTGSIDRIATTVENAVRRQI